MMGEQLLSVMVSAEVHLNRFCALPETARLGAGYFKHSLQCSQHITTLASHCICEVLQHWPVAPEIIMPPIAISIMRQERGL